jgi:YegS/Rv2252/BmrU family lipid kinase
MAGERVVIIYNPMSGRSGRRAEDARHMVELLGTRGVAAQARATTAPGDASKLAREAVAADATVLVSYGGDGTLNEAIQALAGTDVSLAIWPGGTSNVAAHDLGMPSEIEALADVIAAAKRRRIALGLAHSENGKTERRYFLMMAGIGLDASIAAGVNPRWKRRAGELAYWVSGIRHLFTWPADRFSISVDGQKYESAFAIVGKGKGYGGGLRITPHASLEEALFEVYILPPQKRNAAYVPILLACMRGKPESTGAAIVKGRSVTANSSHAPWVEVDGEVIGHLPMRFEAVPDALTLIVP